MRCGVREPNPNYINVLSGIYWQANVPNRRTLFTRPAGQVGNNLGPRTRFGIIGRYVHVSLFKSRDKLCEAWDINDRLAERNSGRLSISGAFQRAVVYSSIINDSLQSALSSRQCPRAMKSTGKIHRRDKSRPLSLPPFPCDRNHSGMKLSCILVFEVINTGGQCNDFAVASLWNYYELLKIDGLQRWPRYTPLFTTKWLLMIVLYRGLEMDWCTYRIKCELLWIFIYQYFPSHFMNLFRCSINSIFQRIHLSGQSLFDHRYGIIQIVISILQCIVNDCCAIVTTVKGNRLFSRRRQLREAEIKMRILGN